MANMFSSLTNNSRSKKMLIVAAATAALLLVALLSLAIVSIVNATRNDVPEDTTPVQNNGIPAGFVTTTFEDNQLYRGNLILVNDVYSYNADANANAEWVTVQNGRISVDGEILYSSNATQTLVQKEALDAMNEMALAFYEATGDDYLWVNVNTDSFYAAGNTFELRYTTAKTEPDNPKRLPISEDATYNWIFTNAYKYGFVQLFTAPTANSGETEVVESQEHIFRYVGKVHAQAMKDKKLATFEDYLTYLRDNTSPSRPLSATVDKLSYKAYYIEKDAQQIIPEKYKETCVVSGDNMSGFVVTYCTTATTVKK